MFQIGVVTNLTPEHLDYHRDMERYVAAKAVLIANTVGRGAERGIVVLNRDDPSYPRFAGLATGLQLGYGLSAAADVKASNIHLSEDHSTFDVATPAEQFPAALALPGLFNVCNALAAIAVGHSQGLDPTSMAEGLRSVTGVSGRMTAVFEGQPYSVVIDYAHTPRALEEVLRFYQGRVKGRIILVFGCEGEQNQGNRQPMGEIAGRLAGGVVVTRDDNRSQSIHAINEAIAGGLQRAGRREGLDYVILPDRRQAIEYASDMAEPGDLVLITGKGHEHSLNIDGREVPWDDEAVAREAIRKNMRSHPEGLP